MNFDVTDLIEVSDEQEPRSSLPRRVVSLLMLALAGYCFWQGAGLFVWEDSARTIAAVASRVESSVVPNAVPITQIDVGDWVFAARNPSSSDDEGSSSSAEVDSSTWRLMILKAYKPNGQPMEVRMLRPLVWLDQHNAQPGKNIYIASKELGFFGDMLVKEIHPCPQLMPRPGPGYEVVTATFRHRRADVIDLSVQDVAEPIGTTPNHPFWSEDRQTFTPAGDLLVGEKLRLANGNLTYVTKTTPRPGTHWVYNLEVNTQHVYHVSNAGLLVHNSNACGRIVYREISIADQERLNQGLGLLPNGSGGSIADQVASQSTNFISASLTKVGTKNFRGGNGLIAININKAIRGGAGFVDHGNVLQAVRRKGTFDDIKNAVQAQEVLFKGAIPFDAIQIIK